MKRLLLLSMVLFCSCSKNTEPSNLEYPDGTSYNFNKMRKDIYVQPN